MLSHVTIGANDLARLQGFYDAVLAPLGLVRRYNSHGGSGYGPPGPARLPSGASSAQLWIMAPFDGKPATPGNGWHCAFVAPSTEAVEAFHAAALAAGGTCEGAPGIRANYAPNYYAAYVRDPEGNKLQAVHRVTSASSSA